MKDIYTTTFNNNTFTIEDLQKAFEIIEKLPPIATELRVFKKGFDVIMKNIPVLDTTRKDEINKDRGYNATFSGLKIVVIENDDGLKINQTRVLYSDGSNKIIDIYKEIS